MPALVALAGKHADLRILGLCKSEGYGYDVAEKKAVRPLTPETYPAHVEKFRSDMKLNYPLAIDDKGANNKTYKILGVPTLVVVDREGIVRWATIGAGEHGLIELVIDGLMKK
jgi:hypothetical protein